MFGPWSESGLAEKFLMLALRFGLSFIFDCDCDFGSRHKRNDPAADVFKGKHI
jgi:hypothetical protein